MPHGTTQALAIVTDPPGAATEVRVDGVSAEPGSDDPNALDLDLTPDVGDWGPAAAGVGVESTQEHEFLDPVTVGYTLSMSARGPSGVKTFSCRVEVEHPAAGGPGFVLHEFPSGFRVALLETGRARHGGVLELRFQVVDPEGRPASGVLRATLGDPPTSRLATHARGRLDEAGVVTLRLPVHWPVGRTQLWISWDGQAERLTDIRVRR